MKKNFALWLAAALFSQPLAAQFTQPIYPVQVEKNIAYGTATNFIGQPETLVLDLYKPLGDGRTDRPVFVYAHGGSWLESSRKDDAGHGQLCAQLAARGYVVANIEYRRGFHRLHDYTGYALCNSTINPFDLNFCVYAYDTSEILRAVFRGMQDMRGAIRFLKNRHALDSTDTQRFTCGGTSAGAFIALQTGFLDCPNEKHPACGDLPPVLPADSEFSDCYPSTLVNLSRPDLGSIEGDLNLGSHDASVVAVADFFGGVFGNLLAGPPAPRRLPALWVFHQTTDVIVNCGTKQPTYDFFEQVIYPLNLCQPIYTIPVAFGGCSICAGVAAAGLPSDNFSCQIVQAGPPNWAANPAGHSIDNLNLRMQQVADFFQPFLLGQKLLAEPIQPCAVPTWDLPEAKFRVQVSPNPFRKSLIINILAENSEPCRWAIADATGQNLTGGNSTLLAGENSIPITANLPAGLYFLTLQLGQNRWQTRLVRLAN